MAVWMDAWRRFKKQRGFWLGSFQSVKKRENIWQTQHKLLRSKTATKRCQPILRSGER